MAKRIGPKLPLIISTSQVQTAMSIPMRRVAGEAEYFFVMRRWIETAKWTAMPLTSISGTALQPAAAPALCRTADSRAPPAYF
jgi:hypothetical protein